MNHPQLNADQATVVRLGLLDNEILRVGRPLVGRLIGEVQDPALLIPNLSYYLAGLPASSFLRISLKN